MSVARRLLPLFVVLVVLITITPSAVMAQQIDEPDDWGNGVLDSAEVSANSPGDLKQAYINYNEEEGTLQFRVNFTSSAPADPMSNNITQIYIDSDLDANTGVNSTTFTDGGDAETFYNNTDDIGADYRISIGDDTNVVVPWDADTTQFDSSSSEGITTERRSDSVVAEVPLSAINGAETIDLKLVYLDTSDGVEGPDDYTWGPDPDDNSIDSVRFDTQNDDGGTVPTATVETVVNISDTPVADDTSVEFELDDADGTTRTVDHDTDNNVTENFTVDSRNFDGSGQFVTATIAGENYTLDAEKEIGDLNEDETVTKVFEPHELIEISGEVSGLQNKEGTYNIEVQNNDEETITTTGDITFDGSSATDAYNLTGVNATEFTSGGSVVASLEAGSNKIEADSSTDFTTSRYNAGDVRQDFTVSQPDQTIDLETNVSDANVYADNAFNLTVSASANGDDKIDTVKHVIEYDPTQVNVTRNEILVEESTNSTDIPPREEGVHEVLISNTSGDPVIAAGASTEIYNLTFEFEENFEPPQGSEVDVTLSTVVDEQSETTGTRMINSTTEKELQFESNPDSVTVTNSETEITIEQVDHLTSGGDMVGAPTKFEVEATSNEGQIKNITLYNTRTNTKNATIECGDSTCSGEITDTPSASTFVGNSTGYESKSVYNITVFPEGDGASVVDTDPRGGEVIYKRADVSLNGQINDAGNVTISDVTSILDVRGQEAGALPWDDIEEAQHDVNNDGVVDIVDVTIVADEYEP